MRVATPVIAILLLTFVPVRVEAAWTELRSANFLFIGDASAGQIRQVAQKLEQFREVMSRALPDATVVSPVPTVVVVFARDRSFMPFKPLFRGNAMEVGGYFQPDEDLNYIAINAESIDFALLTIFHEYSHFLVSNTMGRVPVWVHEGLAEFYQVLQTLDGGKSAVIGRAPGHHIELLKESTLIPIRELLAVDDKSPVYNEGSRRGVFYAQSWALTHYLTLGSKARAAQFRQYLASLRTGSAPDQAFREVFGNDTAALERELFDYVRQYTFPALRLEFAEKVGANVNERGERMDDAYAESYLGDLQARIGRADEARSRLQSTLKRRPGVARATLALGLMEFRNRSLSGALPLLEQAAEQGPSDAFVQVSLGRALIALLLEQRDDPTASAATLRKARTVLSRASELDPSSATAAWMFGYAELVAGGDLAQSVALLERAVRLAPSREQYRLLLAEVLFRQGALDRATSYLGPLLASGGSLEIRNDARRLLTDVANQRTRIASGGGPVPAPVGGPISSSTIASITSLTSRESPSVVRPDLRLVKEGEAQVLGLFHSIECSADLIILVIDAGGKPVRLGAKRFEDVDFISYRTESPGKVACGAIPTPQRVLATYRPNQAKTVTDTLDGDAIAIELLPDGFITR